MTAIHKLLTRNTFYASLTLWYKLLYLTTNTTKNKYGNEFWNLPTSIDFDYLALAEEFHLYVIHKSNDGWYAELWHSEKEKPARKSNPLHMSNTAVDAKQITMKHPSKEVLLEALSKDIATFQDDSESESRKRRNAIKEGKGIDPYVGTTRYEAEELRDKILVKGRSNELQTLEAHGGINPRSTDFSYEVTIGAEDSVETKDAKEDSAKDEATKPKSIWERVISTIKSTKLRI